MADLFSQLLDYEFGYFWVLAGMVLIILESLGAALALASIGVGALITAVFAFLGLLSLSGLLVVFVVASLAMFGISRPLAHRLTGEGNKVKTNTEAMLDRTGLVIRPIGGKTQPGYVKLSGDEWRAFPVADMAIPAGVQVVIRKVEGNTLTVEPCQPVKEENA
ncbi:MAG: NfeD family protein [Deltaproteobacteria bacterium]|nr:NfeD family protein [Deltaproteobacteria bacterium]